MKKKIRLCNQIRFPGFHGLDGCDGLSIKTLRLSGTSSYKTSRLTILYSRKNPSAGTLHKLSCSVRQSIILVIAFLHRITWLLLLLVQCLLWVSVNPTPIFCLVLVLHFLRRGFLFPPKLSSQWRRSPQLWPLVSLKLSTD